MPEFAYVARDLSGQKVSGMLSAPSRKEALAVLDQRALFPVDVEARQEAAKTWRGRRIGANRLAAAYGQLGDLLRSGVPLLRALEILETQSSHPGLSEVFSDVRSHVEEGVTLADAFARHSKVFSEMAISMVRAGGEGGFLEDALERVAEFTEQQEDLKSRTLGAIAYPVFLAIVGTLVVTILIVFFVPKFAELFDRLRERGELPWVTEALLALSDFLGGWGWILLVVAVPLALMAKGYLSTDDGKTWRDRVKLRLPGVGKIFLNLAVARFCRVLGTLLHNGVPILRSLDISSSAAGNRVLAAAIQEAAENISAGESLAVPLGQCGKFPPAVVEMISVAEESNTLEKVLVDIADGMERRTWRQLDLFVRLLEPAMLLVLASVILVVVIALLLPVIKMSSTIQ